MAVLHALCPLCHRAGSVVRRIVSGRVVAKCGSCWAKRDIAAAGSTTIRKADQIREGDVYEVQR